MKKRLLSMLLALAMCLSVFPATAWANTSQEDDAQPTQPALITEIAVNGFTAPVCGASPDFELTVPEGAPYHFASKLELQAGDYGQVNDAINGIWWRRGNDTMASTDTFEDGSS